MTHRRDRNRKVAIVHADEAIIVVDKSPGVLCVPGRGGHANLVDRLRDRPEFADDEPLRVVQRLDKDASGVMVFARTRAAQQHLVRQFMDRTVEKTYLALVIGYVDSDGEIDLPIRYSKRRACFEATQEHGKPALTRYRILKRLSGNTLVECRPVTGRTHQIRVHFAAIDHPLTVDPAYGGGEQVMLSKYKSGYRQGIRHEERPLIDRLTLHAARIAFAHPLNEEPVAYEAPLPKDLRATLKQLERLCGE